jgi:hypothetical protein
MRTLATATADADIPTTRIIEGAMTIAGPPDINDLRRKWDILSAAYEDFRSSFGIFLGARSHEDSGLEDAPPSTKLSSKANSAFGLFEQFSSYTLSPSPSAEPVGALGGSGAFRTGTLGTGAPGTGALGTGTLGTGGLGTGLFLTPDDPDAREKALAARYQTITVEAVTRTNQLMQGLASGPFGTNPQTATAQLIQINETALNAYEALLIEVSALADNGRPSLLAYLKSAIDETKKALATCGVMTTQNLAAERSQQQIMQDAGRVVLETMKGAADQQRRAAEQANQSFRDYLKS